jgi:group I intron endonuclease
MNKIYTLKDPFTQEVRYVGKTKNDLIKRLYEHCTERNLIKNSHKNNWIKKLKKQDTRPIIELIELTENWKEREAYWIKYFRDKGINLTNETDGGDGCIGIKRSQEYIEKLINIKRKNGTLKRSAECRKKISDSHKGKKMSDNHKEILLSYSTKKMKRIIQYDLNMNLVKIWSGIRECSRALNINHSEIIKCLKNKKRNYKNYIWKYEND